MRTLDSGGEDVQLDITESLETSRLRAGVEGLSLTPFLGDLLAPSAVRGVVEHEAWCVGVEVAGPLADDVDRHARFPHESLAAMREAGLLAAMVPVEFGGQGATLATMAGAVRALAFHCASSALVLAMHSLEIGDLTRHGTTPQLRDFLVEVAEHQLLLANAGSEVGIGGDASRSRCALEHFVDGTWRLEKQALAVSYGEHADAVIATARRNPDTSEIDVVQVVCRRPGLKLEETSAWDTIGLRGTCSSSFRLQAEGDEGLVFPVPWAVSSARGYVQMAQILQSCVWVGIAEAAASKAHRYVREQARRSIGTAPRGALRLAELATKIHQARSLVAATALRYEAVKDTDDVEDVHFIIALRSLKVSTSQLAVEVATTALAICGIAGYQRQGPHALDRLVRDALGSLVMVGNDRYLHDNAQLLLALTTI